MNPDDRGSSVGYDDLLQSVSEIAEAMRTLNRDAEAAYVPLVEDILRTRSRDVHVIEHTLDGLLGFCGDERLLLLYRRLCRQLWDLDSAAAVAYVNFYREMYDPTEAGEWRGQRLPSRRPGR